MEVIWYKKRHRTGHKLLVNKMLQCLNIDFIQLWNWIRLTAELVSKLECLPWLFFFLSSCSLLMDWNWKHLLLGGTWQDMSAAIGWDKIMLSMVMSHKLTFPSCPTQIRKSWEYTKSHVFQIQACCHLVTLGHLRDNVSCPLTCQYLSARCAVISILLLFIDIEIFWSSCVFYFLRHWCSLAWLSIAWSIV